MAVAVASILGAFSWSARWAPFGGFKHSGSGRENGTKVILEYLEAKRVLINAKWDIPSPLVMSTPGASDRGLKAADYAPII